MLIVVNAQTGRNELHPVLAPTAGAPALLASILNSPSHHSLLFPVRYSHILTFPVALESHKHREPQAAAQEQAQLAERVPELEPSTSSARPSSESTLGNIVLQGASSSWRLTAWKATKRRGCGREKLMLPASPGYACPSCWGLNVCILPSIGKLLRLLKAVPENLTFLLMIHLPPHCIKDIKWVS